MFYEITKIIHEQDLSEDVGGTPADDADHCPQEDAEGLIVEHQHNTDTGQQAGIVPVATSRILNTRYNYTSFFKDLYFNSYTLVSGIFLDKDIKSETASDIPYLCMSLGDPESRTG